ncbi:hypothetical protein ABZ379_40570 [Streptomyces canus]
MRLRRIAMGGAVLGLVGVVVRAEGRAMGRVLLRKNDAGVSGTPAAASGRARTETAAGRAAGAREQRVPASDGGPREGHVAGSGGGDRVRPVPASSVSGREPSVAASGGGDRVQPVLGSGVGGREPSVSASGVDGREAIKSWNGSTLHHSGTLFNSCPVDLLAVHKAHNSGSGCDLTADVGRPPTLHTKIDSAEAADGQVARGAGAGRIP